MMVTSQAIEQDMMAQWDGKHAVNRDLYLAPTLVPTIRNAAMETALETLRGSQVPHYDAIAIIGASGIFGGMLAFALDKPLMVLRKDETVLASHSKNHYEGPAIPCRVLLVDDFVRSGRTVSRMREMLMARGHTVIGAYFYDDAPTNWRHKPGNADMAVQQLRWKGYGFPSHDARIARYHAVLKNPEVENL